MSAMFVAEHNNQDLCVFLKTFKRSLWCISQL